MKKFTKQELIKHLESITLKSIEQDCFSTPDWEEREYYFKLNRDVAKTLKESSLPKESLFMSNETGSTIVLVHNHKEIKLLGIFRDTFSMGGSCSRYCYQYLQKFRSALETCEAFLME